MNNAHAATEPTIKFTPKDGSVLVYLDETVVGYMTRIGSDHKGIAHVYRAVIMRPGQFVEKQIWSRKASEQFFHDNLTA